MWSNSFQSLPLFQFVMAHYVLFLLICIHTMASTFASTLSEAKDAMQILAGGSKLQTTPGKQEYT